MSTELKVGDRVRHAKFGDGTVTGIDGVVVVNFDRVGTRRVLGTYLTHADAKVRSEPTASVTTERYPAVSELKAGDVFRRPRGFRRPLEGYPQDTWWTASKLNPATAEGLECLEIIEVVLTTTFGRLVVYREWWVDPDGNEVESTQSWIPNKRAADISDERSMLRTIAKKKMERVGRVTKEKTPVDEPEDKNRIDLSNMPVAGTA